MLDDRAFVVDSATEVAPMQRLVDELRDFLALPASARDDPAEPPPTVAAIVTAVLGAAAVAAMIVVEVAQIGDARRLELTATATSAAAVVALAFALAGALAIVGRDLVRRRLHASFGIS